MAGGLTGAAYATLYPRPRGAIGPDKFIPLAEECGMIGKIGLFVLRAALAEHRWGAGQGCSSVVYLTIGTGVGGGIVMDGELVRGGFGMGGNTGKRLDQMRADRAGDGARQR